MTTLSIQTLSGSAPQHLRHPAHNGGVSSSASSSNVTPPTGHNPARHSYNQVHLREEDCSPDGAPAARSPDVDDDDDANVVVLLDDPEEEYYPHPPQTCQSWMRSLASEVVSSADQVFLKSKLSVLLICGVIAVVGDSTQLLGEAACFALSGIALIPCAERLSFLTEQVAEHTNGTIGALLNATFGNAPELLIAVAALRSGFYRVVQLAMLGSILTNMILVFGVACLIGGLRWQVQVLRLTSGNISVVMLLASTAGFLFPAALLMSGQIGDVTGKRSIPDQDTADSHDGRAHTEAEVTFCRVNAAAMMILYLLFLVFTLGTHQSEFADQPLKDHSGRRAQRNLFCLFQFRRAHSLVVQRTGSFAALRNRGPGVELVTLGGGTGSKPYELLAGATSAANAKAKTSTRGDEDNGSFSYDEDDDDNNNNNVIASADSPSPLHRRPSSVSGRSSDGGRRAATATTTTTTTNEVGGEGWTPPPLPPRNESTPPRPYPHLLQARISAPRSSADYHRHHLNPSPPSSPRVSPDSRSADHLLGPMSPMDFYDVEGADAEPEPDGLSMSPSSEDSAPLLSMRTGIFWLFVMTLCISALSDILVDTIDGFAQRMNLSEVFTSMVVVPFFSNVAEQVSAFLFAYRNEMDLVVGVTIGSAIQIASFVLPGSVLIGMVMDRSMTLYFRGYETVCMLFGVIVVGAVLQGGTTNWLVGAVLVGIYVIMATGIWFHELENLAVDGEDLIRNSTYPDLTP